MRQAVLADARPITLEQRLIAGALAAGIGLAAGVLGFAALAAVGTRLTGVIVAPSFLAVDAAAAAFLAGAYTIRFARRRPGVAVASMAILTDLIAVWLAPIALALRPDPDAAPMPGPAEMLAFAVMSPVGAAVTAPLLPVVAVAAGLWVALVRRYVVHGSGERWERRADLRQAALLSIAYTAVLALAFLFLLAVFASFGDGGFD